MSDDGQTSLFDEYRGITLAQARAELFAELDAGNGTLCPCCDKHAQIYRWNLYKSAVSMLDRMHRMAGLEFIESKEAKTGRSYSHCSQLKFWGLVENEKTRRPDGGRSGWWCVTEKGQAFLRNQVQVPKYAFVYDNEVLRFDETILVRVTDIVVDFDWRQHMHGAQGSFA